VPPSAAPAAATSPTPGDLVNWLLFAIGVLMIAWEVVSLVWLMRKGNRLPVT
jgi:hypothetical protein